MRRQRFVGVVSVFVGLLLTAPAATAQALPSSTADADAFSTLDVRLGDTLIVKTRDTPSVKWTLLSITNDQLTLDVRGSHVTILTTDVQVVKRQQVTVVFGTVAGAMGGLGVGYALGDSPYFRRSGFAMTGALIGAGIGFAVDCADQRASHGLSPRRARLGGSRGGWPSRRNQRAAGVLEKRWRS
jgi:hypothetical protein